MSLKDLRECIPIQQRAINQLLASPRNSLSALPNELSDWSAFRKSFWEKGLESLYVEQDIERDTEDPVDPFPDPIPPTRLVLELPSTLSDVWDLATHQVLVRSEYPIAEEAALLAQRERDAFLVTGQPGIGLSLPFLLPMGSNIQSGKSVFLIWLLVRRLALGLPTALQYDKNFAILFHKDGVSQFADLKNHLTYSAFKYPPAEDPKQVGDDPMQVEDDPTQAEGGRERAEDSPG